MASDPPRIVETKRVYTRLEHSRHFHRRGYGCAAARHKRELVDHGDAAAVLVIDRRSSTALLVRQWRAGLLGRSDDPFLLEACAGLIDPDETPETAVRREAEEELGITIGALRSLGSIVPSAGTLTERIHLFIAELSGDEHRGIGGGNAHEGETIEVVEVPIANLFDMARKGAIEDAKTLILVQHLMLVEAGAV